MKSFTDILRQAPDVSVLLANHQQYWGHIRENKDPETLHEHVTLVNTYAEKLVAAHGLDAVIDELIKGILTSSPSIANEGEVGNWLKKLFVHVIVFHDFGKVNENFQHSRLKNLAFSPDLQSILKPVYGHSFLGTYLFVAFHSDEIAKTALSNDEKSLLITYTIFLSYSILQHHSPILKEAAEEDILTSSKGLFEYLKKYVSCYGYTLDSEMLESVFENILGIWSSIQETEENPIISFPLFAFIKLNFSLLTASDYLATHDYMSDAETTDFGVLADRERIKEFTSHLRQYKHNRTVFKQLEGFQFEHPTEKSKDNLNRLRLEMAVELVQTIRKNTDQRLFYIEAPTGGGKTNLSMIALTELLDQNPEINKIYYVFPFTTLITQTYQALQETLDLTSQELVQLHSKAGFHSKEGKPTEEEAEDGVFGDKKKDFIDNLFALYPVIVLSHVKFFNVLKTNHKETNYLLHRLANSVIVIDELQTYNPAIWDKMLYFISQYAAYFNIRFVLMSATLPKISELTIGLVNKPVFVDLLPNAKQYLRNANFAQRVNFRFDLFDKEITPEGLASVVIEKSEEYIASNQKYRSVYTIVEFIYKKTATAFHQLIAKQKHPFDKIVVLSGTILEPRRRYIINYLKNEKNRGQNILLITTQVVEAGVDIDMDLGFKNISLIDSDEQLAGRVNRNASKPHCEVYLFRLDDAKVLYQSDERYKVTRDKISAAEYEEILLTKNFEKLYQLVFERKDNHNGNSGWADNLENSFLSPGIERLNYSLVDKEFKIIDQQNESVFVPIELDVFVESADPENRVEQIFSEEELAFLTQIEAFRAGASKVNGREVWQAYEYLIHHRSEGFNINDKVKFKILQSIMSKFTFSLVTFSKMIPALKSFCLNGDHTYGYLYLIHHERVYSLESGLIESEFDSSENYFL